MKKFFKFFGLPTLMFAAGIVIFVLMKAMKLTYPAENISAAITAVLIVAGTILTINTLKSKEFEKAYEAEIKKQEENSKKPENQWKEKIKVFIEAVFFGLLALNRIFRFTGNDRGAMVVLAVFVCFISVCIAVAVVYGIYKRLNK